MSESQWLPVIAHSCVLRPSHDDRGVNVFVASLQSAFTMFNRQPLNDAESHCSPDFTALDINESSGQSKSMRYCLQSATIPSVMAAEIIIGKDSSGITPCLLNRFASRLARFHHQSCNLQGALTMYKLAISGTASRLAGCFGTISWLPINENKLITCGGCFAPPSG